MACLRVSRRRDRWQRRLPRLWEEGSGEGGTVLSGGAAAAGGSVCRRGGGVGPVLVAAAVSGVHVPVAAVSGAGVRRGSQLGAAVRRSGGVAVPGSGRVPARGVAERAAGAVARTSRPGEDGVLAGGELLPKPIAARLDPIRHPLVRYRGRARDLPDLPLLF